MTFARIWNIENSYSKIDTLTQFIITLLTWL
jgi:hypothetical protein